MTAAADFFPNCKLPAIPADWIDTSWPHNCGPSFASKTAHVFIDARPGNRRPYTIIDGDGDGELLRCADWELICAYVRRRDAMAAHRGVKKISAPETPRVETTARVVIQGGAILPL